MNKSATMPAIAKACNLSPMTVSRAFRRNSYVAPATRQRILSIAAKMGYKPDGRMGRPREQSGKTRNKVRILLGEKIGGANFYHACLLGVIERSLAQQRCDCLLRTCDGSYDAFVWLCETFRSEPNLPTMIIGFFPLDQLRTLLELTPAAILVDYTPPPMLTSPHDNIGFDNIEAGHLAVRHLIETGRKRILLIKGYPDHFFSMEIEKGYRDILLANGIEPDESLIVAADFTANGAYQCALNLIDRGLKFDAVFTNDEMALGAMRALAEKGVTIPDQVAIMGCDGLPYGQFIRPSLTTVVLDYTELGRMAVEHLLSRNNRKRTAVRLRLAPKLAVRESTVGLTEPATKSLTRQRRQPNCHSRVGGNPGENI